MSSMIGEAGAWTLSILLVAKVGGGRGYMCREVGVYMYETEVYRC